MLSRDEVQHIARLSRLALDEEEINMFGLQLNAVIAYVEQLNRLDTTAVEPTSHVIPLQNIVREDAVRAFSPREEMLSNAPDATDRFYRVPKIIE
ncbi:MAG TPA: Asp-tRNA(Asn)/Glu-tRNA(Gln) amidotransferase subunit GatC [Dissulfurispiraceae bacterium]|nr:Asp-tRNA(Asn)/Glu-tRNA(Gln) amidotransferase subunit GatC [Dissulfurispiraceae bacterium]